MTTASNKKAKPASNAPSNTTSMQANAFQLLQNAVTLTTRKINAMNAIMDFTLT
jgi:hypothetical protein